MSNQISKKIEDETVEFLREAGCKVKFFHKRSLYTIGVLNARDHRKIGLAHGSGFERLLEDGAGLAIAGEQQAAGGVLVEPVHRHGRPGEAESEVVKAPFHAVAEHARVVDRQAGRLVNDQGFAVDEQDTIGEFHGGAGGMGRRALQLAPSPRPGAGVCLFFKADAKKRKAIPAPGRDDEVGN